MATKIILTETIDTIGIIGTEASVADGYARNYLLPQKKAVLATPQNKKLLEQQKAKFELQIAKEKTQAEEMAKQLEGVACTIAARVSEEDRLYGSVSTRDIVKVKTITCKLSGKVSAEGKLYGSIGINDILSALADQEITIEKRMLLLADPIKELGTYKVGVRLYKDVEPEITVEVVEEKKNN